MNESESDKVDDQQTDTTEDQAETPPDDDPDKSTPEEFHQALDRLEELAGSLESGDLPLEKAMQFYREGLELIEFCEGRLDDAEMLIEEIEETPDGPRRSSRTPPE